jgi:hypothetical protein
MAIQEYFVFDREFGKKDCEKTIRQFLLTNSDTVRLTSIREGEIGLFYIKHYDEKDPGVQKILEHLKPDFIRKLVNNNRFTDIPQGGKREFDHYFYRLSAKMKRYFNEETLVWPMYPPVSKHFFSLQDPTFYKKGNMIGCVVTHERYVSLSLTPQQKKQLEKKGVKFYDNTCSGSCSCNK